MQNGSGEAGEPSGDGEKVEGENLSFWLRMVRSGKAPLGLARKRAGPGGGETVSLGRDSWERGCCDEELLKE